VEASGAFTVETKVLGETLRYDELEPLLDEVADGGVVLHQVARREALVRAVEEGKVVLLSHDVGNLLPLVEGRVDTGGIVGASMEEDDGAILGLHEGLLHAIKVQALGLLMEVRVFGDGDGYIGEDLVVVDPGRVGQVDLLVARVELGEE